MQTKDKDLVAFIMALHTAPVRRLDDDTYELVGVDEQTPVVDLFSSPTGYNTNVSQFISSKQFLEEMEIYVPPAPVEEEE